MTTGGLSLSFSLATAQLPVRAFSGRPEWRASDDVTTGALTITYTILGFLVVIIVELARKRYST